MSCRCLAICEKTNLTVSFSSQTPDVTAICFTGQSIPDNTFQHSILWNEVRDHSIPLSRKEPVSTVPHWKPGPVLVDVDVDVAVGLDVDVGVNVDVDVDVDVDVIVDVTVAVVDVEVDFNVAVAVVVDRCLADRCCWP